MHREAIPRTCLDGASSGPVRGAAAGSSGKGVRARELFARFEGMLEACGPYEVAPAKTRVAFMGRVRFAGVSAVSEGA
jgi:hypothetical protein